MRLVNINRQIVNQYNVDRDFYRLVNDELLAGSVTPTDFWNGVTAILSQHPDNATQNVETSTKSVSLLSPRYALKALNARWGSLYSALYHESAIPHSTGLKTGNKYNVARGNRVINYAKEFLDSAFPLTEGSHKDAVNYLIYFQNMMVILADGSTTGLKNPAHFAARCGPKCEPDSIVLKHEDLHVEISFDSRGPREGRDVASIKDIHVEAPANTLISFEANDKNEKYEIYRNFKALIEGQLKANFQREGKRHTRRLNTCDCYTAKDGNTYSLQGCNPMVVHLESNNPLALICDSNNIPVSMSLVDTLLCALTLTHGSDAESMPVSLMPIPGQTIEQTEDVLQQLSAIPGMPAIEIKVVTARTEFVQSAKEINKVAAMLPAQISCTNVAEEEFKNTVTLATQNGAVLKAINHYHA